jgi:hypothetical protein
MMFDDGGDLEALHSAHKEAEGLAAVQGRATFGAILFFVLFMSIGLLTAWGARGLFDLDKGQLVIVFVGSQLSAAMSFLGIFLVNYLGGVESRLRVLSLAELARLGDKVVPRPIVEAFRLQRKPSGGTSGGTF